MLDEALALVENSVVYWNDYMRTAKAELPANTMGAPRHNTGGSSRIHYSFGFFELGPDEALIDRREPARRPLLGRPALQHGMVRDARLREPGHEPEPHPGPLSPRRAVPRRRRAPDPGVPNWLDTQGYEQGMITFRWISARTDPTLSATVVPAAAVADHLPAGTPTVDADARREEIRRRQAHIAWRYRT